MNSLRKFGHSASSLTGIGFWTVLLLCGCANPIPPTGGPKDTTPPALVTEASTPNFLTQFDRKEILLTFDEWVLLKDPAQQIVISPPLAKRPDIRLKGKTVHIQFDPDEQFREQTTYTINFGGSIVDLTEGNAVDQFQYIFSTGTFIDSLKVSGAVVDAIDGSPSKDVLILLHDNLADSAFQKSTPTYFAKTDATGRWHIDHVRSDTFRVYALGDLNFNYKYDQPGEKIAFTDRLIILPDTTDTQYKLTLFSEDQLPAILDVNRRTAGVTRITLTTAPLDLSVTSMTTSPNIDWRTLRDSVFVFNPGVDSALVVLADRAIVLDTLRINGYPGQGAPKLICNPTAKSIHPAKPLVLQCNLPLSEVAAERVYGILADTIVMRDLDVSIDSLDNRYVRIAHRWQEKSAYRMVLPAGTIRDIFGQETDSMNIVFQVSSAGNFGKIFLQLEGLVDSVQYVVQLLQQNGSLADETLIRGGSDGKISFAALSPQSYQIRIAEDRNSNGRWDTGNFTQHRQPERVQIETLEPLRAGWDLQATLTWKEFQD